MKGRYNTMIIYHDTEKELFDYISIPASLRNETVESLTELIENLEEAQCNFWINGNDLYAGAIGCDIQKAKNYLHFAKRRKKA